MISLVDDRAGSLRARDYDLVEGFGNLSMLSTRRAPKRALPCDTWAGRDLRSVLQDHQGTLHFAIVECHMKCYRQRWCVALGRIQRNGVHLVTWRCIVCGAQAKTAGTSKGPCPFWELPLWSNNTDETPCARCGKQEGVEQHHWAPSHLFEDAWNWPTSPLCRECHRRWHAVVTPNMAQARSR